MIRSEGGGSVNDEKTEKPDADELAAAEAGKSRRIPASGSARRKTKAAIGP